MSSLDDPHYLTHYNGFVLATGKWGLIKRNDGTWGLSFAGTDSDRISKGSTANGIEARTEQDARLALRALTLLSATVAGRPWFEAASAPKDGSPILGRVGGAWHQVSWHAPGFGWLEAGPDPRVGWADAALEGWLPLPGQVSPLVKDEQAARIRELEGQVEQLRVQLAGCATAALGFTAEDQVAKPGDYGYSASYGDVLSLRRRFEARGDRIALMVKALGGVMNNDKTPDYKHGDRNRRGEDAGFGTSWATPREIAKDLLDNHPAID